MDWWRGVRWLRFENMRDFWVRESQRFRLVPYMKPKVYTTHEATHRYYLGILYFYYSSVNINHKQSFTKWFKKYIYISEQLDRKQRKINLGNQSSLLHSQTVRKVVKQSPRLINTQYNTKLCTIGPTSTRLWENSIGDYRRYPIQNTSCKILVT